MRSRVVVPRLTWIALAVLAPATALTAGTLEVLAVAAGQAGHDRLADVGAKQSKPVSHLWALFTEFERTFGDALLPLPVSPPTGNWILGLGPAFPFPSSTADGFGRQQWALGWRAIVGSKTKDGRSR